MKCVHAPAGSVQSPRNIVHEPRRGIHADRRNDDDVPKNVLAARMSVNVVTKNDGLVRKNGQIASVCAIRGFNVSVRDASGGADIFLDPVPATFQQVLLRATPAA